MARLNGIALLGVLGDQELAALERICVFRRYGRNETVVDRNSENRDIFFIVDGKVQVVNFSSTGRTVALATLSTGGFFGELAAIDGEPRSASVIALEPSRLASLGPGDFIQLLRRHPDLAISVLRRLAKIIRSNDERIMDLTTVSAPQRIHRELMRLAEPDIVAPGRWVIRPMQTHDRIAGHTSTRRETVSRILSQLAQDGVVERKGKTLYIRDMEKLVELAGQPMTAR